MQLSTEDNRYLWDRSELQQRSLRQAAQAVQNFLGWSGTQPQTILHHVSYDCFVDFIVLFLWISLFELNETHVLL